MAVGARHVVVVALVTLLVTYAVYQGRSSTSPSGGASTVAGRKGLSDTRSSETAPEILADHQDSVTETEIETTEDATVETLEADAQSPTLVESEETSDEQTSEEVSDEVEVEVAELVEVEVSEEPAVEEESEETTTTTATSEEATTEAMSPAEDNLQETEENVDISAEETQEASPFEGKQVRELEAASGPISEIVNPDASNYPKPKDNPDVFLQEISRDNWMARQNEGFIQSCIKEDGCGTPDP